MFNFGIFLPVLFAISLVGIIVGFIIKNKKLRNISLIIAGIIIVIFVILEGFVFE